MRDESSASHGTDKTAGEEIWWLPVRDFAAHATVGTLVFVVIAIPAILIDFGLKRLEFGDTVLGWGLRLGEYAIFAADLVLFVFFLIKSAWRAGKRL